MPSVMLPNGRSKTVVLPDRGPGQATVRDLKEQDEELAGRQAFYSRPDGVWEELSDDDRLPADGPVQFAVRTRAGSA